MYELLTLNLLKFKKTQLQNIIFDFTKILFFSFKTDNLFRLFFSLIFYCYILFTNQHFSFVTLFLLRFYKLSKKTFCSKVGLLFYH